MLFFAILTASLASGMAVNATFHKVAEPIDDHYIIVMKSGYDVVPMKKLILGDRSGIFSGATIKHTYTKAIKGFSAKLSKRAVEKLLARDEIKYISQDGVVRVSAVAQWGLDRISQRLLPLDGDYNFTGNGSGVNVYVIDTGIYPESMYFGGRAKVAYDSTRNGTYGIDIDGHGTHCAGTIGAEIFGVAPGVNLFGVRVLVGGGKNGTAADVVAGCDYVAKLSEQPAVASMSLGGGRSMAVDDAVRGIIDAGITTVVSAGNKNTDACLFSPAGVKEAITVGATVINDRRASFSNYGTCVDAFAPGVRIPSVSIRGEEVLQVLNGTSMACPHVAGAVAIALGNSKGMSPSDLKTKILGDTTTDVVEDARPGSPNRLLYVP